MVDQIVLKLGIMPQKRASGKSWSQIMRLRSLGLGEFEIVHKVGDNVFLSFTILNLKHPQGKSVRVPRLTGPIYNLLLSVDTARVFDLPIVARPGSIFLFFVGELLVLHVVFIAIPYFRLKKF